MFAVAALMLAVAALMLGEPYWFMSHCLAMASRVEATSGR